MTETKSPLVDEERSDLLRRTEEHEVSSAISYLGDYSDHEYSDHAENRRTLATLCLKGQPFGFTREMLYRLRILIKNVESLPTSFTDEEDAIWLTEIADLISALIPPEKT